MKNAANSITVRDPTVPGDRRSETCCLLYALGDGDRTAESRLSRRFLQRLLVVLRGRTDAATAEDLVQSSLLIVLTKLRSGELRQPDRLEAFVHGTARQLLRAHWRTMDRAPKIDAAELPSDTPTLLQLTESSQRIVATKCAIAELRSGRDRELLLRYYLLEHSSARIGADLGLTRVGFRKALGRARHRVRSILSESGYLNE